MWQLPEGEQREKGFTVTISRFGCAFYSHAHLRPGTKVKLKLEAEVIDGRVVHALKDHSTKLVTLGIAFEQDASEFWQVGFDFLASTTPT